MCSRMCFLAWIALWLVSGMFARDAGAQADSTQDRRWAFAATVISQGVNEIAVSKKVTQKTMLLLGLGFQWDASDQLRESDELGQVKSAKIETKRYFAEIRPEWRRYFNGVAPWSLYFGLQPHFGYAREKSKITFEYKDPQPPDPENPYEPPVKTTLSLGLATTLGVEYLLLRNLSLSIHFRPLIYTYSYDKAPSSTHPYAEVTSTIKEHRVAFAQNTAIFLRIYF